METNPRKKKSLPTVVLEVYPSGYRFLKGKGFFFVLYILALFLVRYIDDKEKLF